MDDLTLVEQVISLLGLGHSNIIYEIFTFLIVMFVMFFSFNLILHLIRIFERRK